MQQTAARVAICGGLAEGTSPEPHRARTTLRSSRRPRVILFALDWQRAGMKGVELYGRVRRAVRIEGLSERAAARRFGLDPRTVNKMMKFSVSPGYVRKKPPAKPKLDAFVPMIDRSRGRQVATEETAAYGEADLRAASGRTRRHWPHPAGDRPQPSVRGPFGTCSWGWG